MTTPLRTRAESLYTVEPFKGRLAVLDRGDAPAAERFNCYAEDEAAGWRIAERLAAGSLPPDARAFAGGGL